MGTSKSINFLFVLFFSVTLNSCNNRNREFVKNQIWIWNWNNEILIPKKAVLLKYEKKSNELLETYKNDVLKIQLDSLNKKEYLLISFQTPQSKLSTNNTYELIIDDTIHYKIFNFKTATKNQGGDMSVQINNKYFTEIGDDNVIQFNKNFMEIIQK